MAFKILWGIDAVIALIFAVFFVIGIADGTVSSFNIGLWLVILCILGGVLAGGPALQRAGRAHLARALLTILAVPGLLAGIFFLALIILHPRWN